MSQDSKIVYRRYASLFFIAGCASTDNELITLEIVHRYVEQMDKYYGNVCELDIIFNFQKAYFILDELLIAGEMQESSKKNVLRVISAQDSIEDTEVSPNVTSLCHRWSRFFTGLKVDGALGLHSTFSCTNTDCACTRSMRRSRRSCEHNAFVHIIHITGGRRLAIIGPHSIMTHISAMPVEFLLLTRD